jgi:hypothetical protein
VSHISRVTSLTFHDNVNSLRFQDIHDPRLQGITGTNIDTQLLRFANIHGHRYTKGTSAGACCPKSIVLPGKLMTPACTTCGGEFYQMDGKPTVGPPPPERNSSAVGEWSDPVIVETGTEAHQLYVTPRLLYADAHVYMCLNGTLNAMSTHGIAAHC